MKKWLMIFATVTLAACSGTSSVKTYYQLPQSTQPAKQAVSQQGTRLLWIDQVTVSDFLAQNGVVYQTSDVQYVIATQNLWASPLDQQLRTTLVSHLSNMLPGWIVASQPLGSDQCTLNINVTGFQGRYDGKVVVSGEWLLHQGETLIKRPFQVVLAQPEDGYDSMVKTLARGWKQEAQSIASELQ